MSSKRKARRQTPPPVRASATPNPPRRQAPADKRVLGMPVRVAAGAGAVVLVAVLAIGAIALFGSGGSSTAASPTPTAQTAVATASPTQWAFHGTSGTWTNVNPDRLAEMLATKDFTLVNVKTPYFAEIEKTDLFVPYDQIASQVSKLPQDKAAKILVYCRSGVESAQAAETLASLGYTNVWNLDGGMLAWQASGRQLLYTHKP